MSGVLTHSPADILRRWLVNAGKGTLPSASGTWPISVNQRIDTPDNAISVNDTEGRKNGRVMPTGEVIEHPGVQVEVRGATHNEGYTKAKALAVVLDEEINNETVTFESKTYTITAVSRSGGVLVLGKETPTSKRYLFTVNATMTVTQTN